MNEALYQAHLLDHYKRPRNKGVIGDASIVQTGSNPSCGDSLKLYLKIDDGVIAQAAFEGEGCAISQAAASMLTEKLIGMNRTDAAALTESYMYDLLKVKVSSGREKCALLAYRALQDSLEV